MELTTDCRHVAAVAAAPAAAAAVTMTAMQTDSKDDGNGNGDGCSAHAAPSLSWLCFEPVRPLFPRGVHFWWTRAL